MTIDESLYPPHTRQEFVLALDAELATRVQSLSEPPHTSSECWGSMRSCVVEAAAWAALGVIIWIATLMYFT